ncbi:hypothetical protein QAD02_006641 [Eretmocerus hayati]|uniref:Uncharacterized protein n=1 Tax=Eretmocerus hayati TaxID=131215 RepID=A0ACC2N1Q4_9HYME|nr:hypothetical protein QAD02_006641 [Eretmocerus hayati]
MLLHQLTNTTIILFIAAGVQTILILFIFAKRQIMRFSLRSRRGPHTPIAYDTEKALRKEIERRIQVIPRIQFEPHLQECYQRSLDACHQSSTYYRVKTVNGLKILDTHIMNRDSSYKRHPNENIRRFLINVLPATFNDNGQHLIHEFCDLYERARHDPSKFKSEDYATYSKILLKLIDASS